MATSYFKNNDEIIAVKKIREVIGLSLFESVDFVRKEPDTWEKRLAAEEARLFKKEVYLSDRDKVVQALQEYDSMIKFMTYEAAGLKLVAKLRQELNIPENT